MSKKKGKKAPMGPARKILIVICLIVFCGSGYYIADYVIDNHTAQKNMNQVLQEKNEIGLVKLHKKNKDLIGWVKIDGTKIDYPVMQTPDDPEFYLHRNFKKEASEAGTLFMDAQSIVADLPKEAGSAQDGYTADTERTDYGEAGTWNWLVYGHNMKYGTMFQNLLKFEKEDFYKEHKTFLFSVLRKDPNTGKLYEDTDEYEIIAAAYSEIYPKSSNAFRYYGYPGSTSKAEFKEFVKGVRAESIYKAGKKPKYGTQLVILSTCAYHTKEGRFYIVGARMDD